MKKIVTLLVLAAVAAISVVSCAKDTTPVIPEPEDTAQVYGVDLAFDAPAGLSEAVVYFFDGHGQQVAVDNITVPATTAESVTASFLSETAPEYILTEGLQNTGENGLLAIPRSSVSTRAGYNPVLLVIRF